MSFRYLGPDQVEQQLDRVLHELAAGRPPREIELRNVDVKEEPGRRGPGGAVQPGRPENEEAAAMLARELACMANTDGGGAIILGVADDGQRIGTELDPEWLRHRIHELTRSLLTVDVRPAELDHKRILVLRAPEAVEPIRSRGRIMWRVADNCVEVDAASWHAGRLHRSGHDWSVLPSGHTIGQASPAALEVARRFLRESGTESAVALADATDADLLRRLNVVDADGFLTNAGSLLFVATPEPGIDYIRRDHPGADSTLRIQRSGPLLVQLADVEQAAAASNRILHVAAGFVQGQVRALPRLAVREAIVNGVIHRDWQTAAPTVVEHVGDSLVVTSPGGFIGGISPDNIITHPSTPRYRSLTTIMAALHLAEREGIGVDRMVAEMLALGHRPPSIQEIAGPYVRVSLLGGPPDSEWMQFLDTCVPVSVPRDVDMLLLMQQLQVRGWLDARTAAPVLQRNTAEAGAAIDRLAQVRCSSEPVISQVAGVPAGEEPAWRFSNPLRRHLGGRVTAVFDAAVRQRLIMDWARERGRVSSAEAADLTGLTQGYAGTILMELENDGLLTPGRANRRGRGFFYRFATAAST